MKKSEEKNSCPQCGQTIPSDAPESLCPTCALAQVAIEPENSPPSLAGEFPSLDQVARALPNLEILEVIGSGGMGMVYRAKQRQLDRIVAVKILPKKLASDPQFTERFTREAKLLGRLSHPNIVSVYDFGQSEGLFFLIMEYVDGVNLRQAMRAGRFTPKEALEMVPKVCEALQFAHDQGILHRDIKPENILLNNKGEVKIADFGIAKLVGESHSPGLTLTTVGNALGTPHYMAPEQVETPADVDHRADIYSLGVVLYEMLTGELPIGRFDVPSQKTEVNTSIDDIILRALEKDRERRQSSAHELKTEVQGVGERPPTSSGHKVSSVRRPWSYLGICSAILAMAGLAFVALPLLYMLGETESDVPKPTLIMLFPGFALGAVATLLGWIALINIRSSHPQQLGVPFAFFGAASFPLLTLNGVIVGGPILYFQSPEGSPGLSPFGLIFFGFIGLLLSTCLVLIIYRWFKRLPIVPKLTRTTIVVSLIIIAGIIIVLFPWNRANTSQGAATETSATNQSMARVQFNDISIRDDAGTNWLVFDLTQSMNGAEMVFEIHGTFDSVAPVLKETPIFDHQFNVGYGTKRNITMVSLPTEVSLDRLKSEIDRFRTTVLEESSLSWEAGTIRHLINLTKPGGPTVAIYGVGKEVSGQAEPN